MIEELFAFGLEREKSSIIKVIGVGGGGCNAVKNMYEEGIKGVNFMICNTDAQAMQSNPVPIKIQLGVTLTQGRGAGNLPTQGEQAAIENLDDVRDVLEGTTKMVFITAGMGGGTGTGAAPVIARLARELKILTIAVVTIPSKSEGKRRYNQALEGVEKLQQYVDSMLVVSNEKLHKIYGNLPASQAFKKADNIITTAVKGVAEIITLHGNINIDFADVYTVMAGSGVFLMGTGLAEGANRAMNAVRLALESPLLDSSSIRGTQNILLNIISGTEEVTMSEIGEIIDYLQEEAGQDATIIWGNGNDQKLDNQISVTIIATGFDVNPNRVLQPVELIELQAEDNVDFEINIDEDKPEEKVIPGVPKAEPLHQPKPKGGTSETKSKKANDKKSAQKLSKPQGKNAESWITRSFNRFFDDKKGKESSIPEEDMKE